jgi:hypothetical protein
MFPTNWTKGRGKAIHTLVGALISVPLGKWDYFDVTAHNRQPTVRTGLGDCSYGIPYATGEVDLLYIYVPFSDIDKGFSLSLNGESRHRLTAHAEEVRRYIRRQKNDHLDKILSHYHPVT